MIQPLPGYRSAEDHKPILIFIGKEIYKEKSYDEFLKTYEKS
jgi:thioredoxin-related protein